MKREHIIRTVAGTLVLTGLALGSFVNPWYFLITAFVGINLFQSGITKWCLLEKILEKANVGVPCH